MVKRRWKGKSKVLFRKAEGSRALRINHRSERSADGVKETWEKVAVLRERESGLSKSSLKGRGGLQILHQKKAEKEESEPMPLGRGDIPGRK